MRIAILTTSSSERLQRRRQRSVCASLRQRLVLAEI
jgi:hypothetical protein